MIGEPSEHAGLAFAIIMAAAFWLCLLRPWWQSGRAWRASWRAARHASRRGFEVLPSQTTNSEARVDENAR